MSVPKAGWSHARWQAAVWNGGIAEAYTPPVVNVYHGSEVSFTPLAGRTYYGSEISVTPLLRQKTYHGSEVSFTPLAGRTYYGSELSFALVPPGQRTYYGAERRVVPGDVRGAVLSFKTRPLLVDGLHLYVDWNGDGQWDEDIIGDLQSATTALGRDSQLGRAGAGQASLTLVDRDRRYVTENPKSPYHPNILPGRRVQLVYALDNVEWPLFTGYLDECLPDLYNYRTFMTLTDGTEILARATIRLAVQMDEYSGNVWNQVLSAAGWPWYDRLIDHGTEPWPLIYTDEDVNALDILQRLEQSEWGFRYIGPDGREHWEDRHHRLQNDRCLYPQWLCTATDYAHIRPLDPLTAVKNYVVMSSQPRTRAITATWLWTMAERAATGDSPVVEPGKTRSFWARFADANGQAVIAGDVQTPAWNANPDLCAIQANTQADGGGQDGTGLVVVAALHLNENLWASGCRIDITNQAWQALYITQLRVRGHAFVLEGTTEIVARDDESIAQCGRREYRVNVPFYQRIGVHEDVAEHIVDVAAWPNPSYEVELCFQRSPEVAEQIVKRRISDCVQVRCPDFDLDEAFHIEHIRHEIGLDEWRTFWTLTRAGATTTRYWKLGTALLGVNTHLGY